MCVDNALLLHSMIVFGVTCLQVLEAIDVVTQVVEDARPLLLRAIELADQVHCIAASAIMIRWILCHQRCFNSLTCVHSFTRVDVGHMQHLCGLVLAMYHIT